MFATNWWDIGREVSLDLEVVAIGRPPEQQTNQRAGAEKGGSFLLEAALEIYSIKIRYRRRETLLAGF